MKFIHVGIFFFNFIWYSLRNHGFQRHDRNQKSCSLKQIHCLVFLIWERKFLTSFLISPDLIWNHGFGFDVPLRLLCLHVVNLTLIEVRSAFSFFLNIIVKNVFSTGESLRVYLIFWVLSIWNLTHQNEYGNNLIQNITHMKRISHPSCTYEQC